MSRAKMTRTRTSHSAPSTTIATARYQLNREGNKYVRQVMRVLKNAAMPSTMAIITVAIPFTIARNTAPIPRNNYSKSSLRNVVYSFNTRYDGTHIIVYVFCVLVDGVLIGLNIHKAKSPVIYASLGNKTFVYTFGGHCKT